MSKSRAANPSGWRVKLDACPESAQHTEGPDDYAAWNAWASLKSKTHKQMECPGCGLLVVWVAKPK